MIPEYKEGKNYRFCQKILSNYFQLILKTTIICWLILGN